MNSIGQISARRGAVIILFFITLFINYASNTFLFGASTGEVSDKYSTLFTPAGYAFAIWGLIYLALGIYVFHQTLKTERGGVYDQVAPWLMINLVANSLWLPAFQYEYIALSVVLMLVILGSLVQIYTLISSHGFAAAKPVWTRAPFSLYMGWISVATIVNLALFIKYSGWQIPEASEATWVAIMLSVGVVLAMVVARVARDWIYPLVFAWAYVAIAVQQSGSELIFPAALGAAAVTTALGGITYWQPRTPLLAPTTTNISKYKSSKPLAVVSRCCFGIHQ